MSDDKTSIEVTQETRDRIRELQAPGETTAETVHRLVKRTSEEDSILYSYFTVFAVIAALIWILSFALLGETEANAVGGLFITSTIFWLIWKEMQFQGFM